MLCNNSRANISNSLILSSLLRSNTTHHPGASIAILVTKQDVKKAHTRSQWVMKISIKPKYICLLSLSWCSQHGKPWASWRAGSSRKVHERHRGQMASASYLQKVVPETTKKQPPWFGEALDYPNRVGNSPSLGPSKELKIPKTEQKDFSFSPTELPASASPNGQGHQCLYPSSATTLL